MPRGGEGFSGPLAAIAVAGIALGVVVMIMAVSILRGFQNDISSKVAGFGSHLTVTAFSPSGDYGEQPVLLDSTHLRQLRSLPQVRHIQPFATKGGMVKTDDQIHGILLRGLAPGYDTAFFSQCLVDGQLPHFSDPSADQTPSNDALLSSTIAARLKLRVGDKMRTYFWQENTYRSRAFTVCGIYNTDLSEMDEHYVIGDLRHIQRLNNWTDSNTPYVGGYELLVSDFDRLDQTAAAVAETLPYDLTVRTIRQAHPVLFSWLDLLEVNITLILTIMCIVSAIAIVSALLIMIFEKSATIGLLKALGANNTSIRKIFLLKASQLILKGILAGNTLALALSLAQTHWQLLKLDPESYSMSHVPVEISGWTYLIISAATFAVCLLALLLPAAYISRISPAQTIKNEK